MTEENVRGDVAVLGLGRMGRAMVERLADRGWAVTTWTRSGRTVPGARSVGTPAEAVGAASVVLLALYDGAACRDVLGQVGGALDAGKVVVNTSTIGPGEATALDAEVRSTGADYLHAPVLGSIGAVRSGTLQVLVGSRADDRADVAELVADLGLATPFEDTAAAATAKLMANGVLASALVAIGDARRAAAEAGLDDATALAVLERTAVGGLVGGKKSRLVDRSFGDADFAAGALAKDVALLADVAPAAGTLRRRVAGPLESGRVGPDDDVAALADVPEAPAGAADARLSFAAEVDPASPALTPLVAYALGHATGDPAHFGRAFLPTAHVEGIRDGAFVSWSLDDYCALFSGQPAADEPTRRRHLDRLDVDGTVAGATMTLRHGPDTFTDTFVLLEVDGEWRIANKAYARR